MMLAAVMPLPEGMSELTFAGALGGRRIRMLRRPGWPADSRRHRFLHLRHGRSPTSCCPKARSATTWATTACSTISRCSRVEHVYHRDGAIWPFTVVGRPPQEDTIFGQLIHELTGPGDSRPCCPASSASTRSTRPASIRCCLAIGSERYWPFAETQRPQELLTQANAILGQGQLSLAKFLLIANQADDPQLDIHDIAAFLRHILRAGRLDARPALPNRNHDRHARLLGQRAQRRLEARHRRRRPASASNSPPNCRATCGCPTASATRASSCPASSPSKARCDPTSATLSSHPHSRIDRHVRF